MSGADTDTIETIAYYRSDLPEKFGVPRQSGLAPNLKGRIVFEEKYSDYVGKAFILRNNSDYADFYVVAKPDAEMQYEHAKEFYEKVRQYLEQKSV